MGARLLPGPASAGLWPFIGCAIGAWIAKDRWPRLAPYLVGLLFLTSGWLDARLSLAPPPAPDSIAQLAQKHREVSLLGVLNRSPAVGPERSTLLMDCQALLEGQDWRPAQGLIQLTLPGPPPPGIVPGDLFLARAAIGPVPSYGVPGAFDYREYLAYQGIRASGFIRSPALIAKVTQLPPPSLAQRLRFLPERIRYRLSRLLARTLPQPAAGVYQAILLGEMAGLPPTVLEDFKASGSVHILSISGLHMALVSLVSTLVISFLLRRSTWMLLNLPAPKVAALLSLLPLTLYALIAGFNPPVVRSLVMVAIFILALLVDRQWSIINNLALAALILLAANPPLLFTASFQLTFGAVLAIAIFAPAGSEIIGRLPAPKTDCSLPVRLGHGLRKWGLASILASLAATLGTAPILAWQFNRIPLVSPLSTLLIEPFLCLWSLFLGLAACLLTGLPALAHQMFVWGGLGIKVSVGLARLCARLPASSIWVPTPGLGLTAAWVAGLLLLAHWRRLSRRGVGLGAGLIVILCLIDLRPLLAKPDRPQTRLSVLDVGQGSAMIAELPDGEVFLIDGGRKPSPASAGFDVGENLIAPFLWRRGLTRLTAVICSHPDADHFNGIPFILRHFRPQTLWINGSEHRENGYQELLDLAAQLKVRVRVPVPGQTLGEADGARLVSLTGGQAGQTTSSPTAASVNNQSLVLSLSQGRIRILMPSDIEQQEEEALLSEPNLASTVLVAPHHGSDSSSSEAFVRAVGPRLVAISAGQNQSGHFPAPAVERRYQDLGCRVLETAAHGSIFLATDVQQVKVKTYR